MHVPLSLLPYFVVGLAACVALQCAFLIGMSSRLARQTKMLRQFFSGPQDENLEMLLARTLEDARVARESAKLTTEQMTVLLKRFDGCIQHFALVRYDAFDDVSGGLSFSLALLDGRDNGAIISTICGRTNSRCFGKMISGGQPEQPLSDDEQKALIQALESKVAGGTGGESFNSKVAVLFQEPNHEFVGVTRG